MRKLFSDIEAQVAQFVEQREALSLFVTAGLREYITLCKILESFEQGASPHVFWLVTVPFEDPQQYVSAAIAAFEARHEALAAALAASGGAPPSPLPAARNDAKLSAEQRLRAVLCFARSQIPAAQELLLVAALLPSTIADASAYARFVDSLLEHEFPAPWCHHMRFVVREDAAQQNPPRDRVRARRYAPDLSDHALVAALEAEVNDERQALPQRMQSLMILAGMDSAHRRTADALEKYTLLANYHCELGHMPATALALNGMGEACALANRPAEALQHFERALTPALEVKDLPTLSTITFNLAHLYQSQRAFQRAIELYDSLSVLARASLSAALQLTCHEQRGVCLRELGQDEAALEQWRAGVTLAQGVEMPDQQLNYLRRMAEHFASRQRTRELREVEQQIEQLRQSGAQELPL